MTKTKIIATLGPSSSSYTVIRKMILSGMDVARLNFSHGSYQEHKMRLEIARSINKKYRRHIRIMQDLEGFRIRIGRFKDKEPLELKRRQKVYLTNRDILAAGNIISFDYQGSLTSIKKGQIIYIDDGNIALKVLGHRNKLLVLEVIVGGLLRERKGINIPGLHVKFKGLTTRDSLDIQFGIRYKVDYIAQSFVRDREDVLVLKDKVKKNLAECLIVAKIENQEGIKNIDEIIDVADVIMIARGDMGVCVPFYQIPIIQKQIIRKCNRKKKPVITATQMLESMVEHYLPTRAEITDVANAILDGTDFVMLSAETAAGKYPAEAVKKMNQIINYTEKSPFYKIG